MRAVGSKLPAKRQKLFVYEWELFACQRVTKPQKEKLQYL